MIRQDAFRSRGRYIPGLIAVCFSLVLASQARAQMFIQINLVTDEPDEYVARLTDPALKNAWGASYRGTSPFWVSDNGTGVATIYIVNPKNDAVTKAGLTVTIPGNGTPTGQVSNTNAAAFNGDAFLFVSEDGTVSGWRGALGTTAEVLALASPDNIYKGSAIADVGGHTYLYGANFHAGAINVFKGDAGAPGLAGSFTDLGIPSGYAPFNIQRIGNKLYVSYALQDASAEDEVAGPGLGFVSSFDLDGNFLSRIASNGTLNAPWGLAIAPKTFGMFAGDLLVGNFGDGTINAFDLATDTFEGQLLDHSGNPISIEGLWALLPGNGGNAGSPNRIYFTAGPDDEEHGLFGVLAPESGALAYLAAGMFPALILLRRSRR